MPVGLILFSSENDLHQHPVFLIHETWAQRRAHLSQQLWERPPEGTVAWQGPVSSSVSAVIGAWGCGDLQGARPMSHRPGSRASLTRDAHVTMEWSVGSVKAGMPNTDPAEMFHSTEVSMPGGA